MIPSWLVVSAVALAGLPEWQIDRQDLHWAGGTIVQERAALGELLLDAPPRVRRLDLHGRQVGQVAEFPDVPVITLEPTVSAETAAEEVTLGWGTVPYDRGTLTLFPDGHSARLAWRFHVRAAGSIWSVRVDAQDGTVFHAAAESWSASANVYDPNPTVSALSRAELLGLTDDLTLAGQFAYATTCTDWDIDPRPFGARVCLEWAAVSKATLLGDHLYLPNEGELDDPFTEGQVYYHVDKISRWAATEFGLKLAQPIQLFTNFPLTNAFFGDFNDDGVRDLSFGISDDGYNLGYDSDVVYHEYGHALVRRLAGSLWMQADVLGLDWTPGALNEGVADTFAMIHNPDPLLAESMARSDRWERAIRDLEPERSCPNDLQSQVHRSGQIWGSTTWRMIDDDRIGPDLMAQLLVGAVSGWSNSTDWPDAGQSLIDAATELADQAVIDDQTHAAVVDHVEASGMLDCERIIDLEVTPAMRSTLINYGLGGEYERVAAGVQFRHRLPAEAKQVRLNISDFSGVEVGTGLAVYIRLGAPVEHETMRVEGIGLHHAVPVRFDAVFEIDEVQAELRLDSNTVPGLEPGMDVYGSIASINRSRPPMDVTYVSAVLSASATIDAGGQTVGAPSAGCAAVPLSGLRTDLFYLMFGLLLIVINRRRSGFFA